MDPPTAADNRASGPQSHSLRGTGKRVISSTHDSAPSASTLKCIIQTPDQIFVLKEAIQSSGGPLTCPLCHEDFTVRKSFMRHIRTVIQQNQETGFACGTCNLHFSRRDILVRHEAYQHGEGKKHIQCDVCHQWVRPRSLKGHKQSDACKAALGSGIAGRSEVAVERSNGKEFPWKTFLSVRTQLHAILDCRLLTAWLLATVQPWGQGQESAELWLVQRTATPNYEIWKLMDQIYKSLRQAMAAPDIDTSPHVLDAILLLVVCVNMIEGWWATVPHQNKVLILAAKQLLAMKPTKEAFVDVAPSDALHTVLYRSVAEEQLAKCEKVAGMAIRVMRTAAYGYVSDLTNGFQDSLTWEAVHEHGQSHTPEIFVQRHGPYLMEISTLVSTIGPIA